MTFEESHRALGGGRSGDKLARVGHCWVSVAPVAAPHARSESSMRQNALHRVRHAGALMTVALLLGGVAGAAAKDEFPAQPVKIVVPFVAGGGVDVVARIVAPKLSEALG